MTDLEALKDADPVEHILSKGTVQQELVNYREAEVAKIVAWLRDPDGAWPRATSYSFILADEIEDGKYRNDA